MVDVGRSLTAELDLDVLLERVMQTARELCGAHYAALGVLADGRQPSAAHDTTWLSDPAATSFCARCPT